MTSHGRGNSPSETRKKLPWCRTPREPYSGSPIQLPGLRKTIEGTRARRARRVILRTGTDKQPRNVSICVVVGTFFARPLPCHPASPLRSPPTPTLCSATVHGTPNFIFTPVQICFGDSVYQTYLACSRSFAVPPQFMRRAYPFPNSTKLWCRSNLRTVGSSPLVGISPVG